MHVLAARISKTAIPWRTRGPDARRGQLRFVAGVWPAIVNPVRRRGALMVSWMHSVTVGMAAIVNAVGQRGALMVLWIHSVTVGLAAIVNAVRRDDRRGQYGWPNSHTGEVGFSTTGARPLTAGQYGWPNSSTRQHDTKPLWKLGRGTISTVHQQPHATGGEQAAPDEQRIWRRPATVACPHVAGTGR
jgi:hypothetical protein